MIIENLLGIIIRYHSIFVDQLAQFLLMGYRLARSDPNSTIIESAQMENNRSVACNDK